MNWPATTSYPLTGECITMIISLHRATVKRWCLDDEKWPKEAQLVNQGSMVGTRSEVFWSYRRATKHSFPKTQIMTMTESRQNTQCSFKCIRLCRCSPVRVPMLSPSLSIRKKTVVQRKSVTWSHQSRFLLHHMNGWACVCFTWGRDGTRMHYGKGKP